MIAYRLLNAQTQPEFQEVPDPHAGPGQVVTLTFAVPDYDREKVYGHGH